jgi:hypothetical protein
MEWQNLEIKQSFKERKKKKADRKKKRKKERQAMDAVGKNKAYQDSRCNAKINSSYWNRWSG